MATQTFDMLDTDVVSFVNNSETNDVEMLKLNDNVIWEKYSHIALQVQRVKNSRNEIGFSVGFKTQMDNKYKYKVDNGEWIERTGDDYNSSFSIVVSDFNVHTIDVIGKFYKIESINQAPEQTTGHFYPNIKILNYGFKKITLGEGMLASYSSSTLIDSDVIIPLNVTTLGDQHILGNWRDLYSFKILGDVKEMEIFKQTGMYFKNRQTVNNIGVIEGVAIDYEGTSLVFDGTVIKYIGNELCRDKTNITDITIGEGVTKIGGHAFEGCNNESLINLTIPSSVKNFGVSCFEDTILTTVTFNEPEGVLINLPKAGGGAGIFAFDNGMFYTKTARNMTIKTNNYDIANYDYNADGITATIVHLDGSAWNKTTTPSLSLNGNILTISGSNADKYYIDGGAMYGSFETNQTTIDLKTAFPSFTSGSAYTIKVTGIKTDTSYCRSDTASVSYTPS